MLTTSIRHQEAKNAGKLTAGQLATIISSKLNKKVKAKEVVEAYKLIVGREPEWHHSGRFGNKMGRTWFFDLENRDKGIVDKMVAQWDTLNLNNEPNPNDPFVKKIIERIHELRATAFYNHYKSGWAYYRILDEYPDDEDFIKKVWKLAN